MIACASSSTQATISPCQCPFISLSVSVRHCLCLTWLDLQGSAPAASLSKGDRGHSVHQLQILLVQAGLLAHGRIKYRIGITARRPAARHLSLFVLLFPSLSAAVSVLCVTDTMLCQFHSFRTVVSYCCLCNHLLFLYVCNDTLLNAGIYGDNTVMAVGALQALCDLPPSGRYCSNTETALAALVAEGTMGKWLPEQNNDQETESIQVVQGSLAVLLPHAVLFHVENLPEALQQSLPQPSHSQQSPAMQGAATQLMKVLEGSSSADPAWVNGLDHSECDTLHKEAAHMLHVGHLSIGQPSNADVVPSNHEQVLLWKWCDWGGPGQSVQWNVSVALDGADTHSFILKGRLAADELAAAGMVAGTEQPEPSTRAFTAKTQRTPGRTYIRQVLGKANLTRFVDSNDKVYWTLQWAVSKNAAPLPELTLRHVEEDVFIGQGELYKQHCTVTFDASTIRPQGANLDQPVHQEPIALMQFRVKKGTDELQEVSHTLCQLPTGLCGCSASPHTSVAVKLACSTHISVASVVFCLSPCSLLARFLFNGD